MLLPGDHIQFIALPYLSGFHQTGRMQPVIITQAQQGQNLRDYQWRITATLIPEFCKRSGTLQIMDTDHASGPRLLSTHFIFTPLPIRPGPVSISNIARKPLWLHTIKAGLSRLTWQAPALTPVAAKLAIAEQKRKARLAKRMADRAFYFGYDTNKDALK